MRLRRSVWLRPRQHAAHAAAAVRLGEQRTQLPAVKLRHSLLLLTVLLCSYPHNCRSKGAVGGSEPADAIRAVNALLTRLDQLKAAPNVMARRLLWASWA